MRFNLDQSLQSRELEYSIKAQIYSKLLKISRYKAVRLTGPGLGIASSFLTVCSRMGLIFENIVKGLVNLAGAPVSRKCSFRRGCKQLLVNAPRHIIAIPYTFICATIEIFSKTISMAIHPIKYCAEKRIKFIDKEDFK